VVLDPDAMVEACLDGAASLAASYLDWSIAHLSRLEDPVAMVFPLKQLFSIWVGWTR
jgi:hypothetical protein